MEEKFPLLYGFTDSLIMGISQLIGAYAMGDKSMQAAASSMLTGWNFGLDVVRQEEGILDELRNFPHYFSSFMLDEISIHSAEKHLNATSHVLSLLTNSSFQHFLLEAINSSVSTAGLLIMVGQKHAEVKAEQLHRAALANAADFVETMDEFDT